MTYEDARPHMTQEETNSYPKGEEYLTGVTVTTGTTVTSTTTVTKIHPAGCIIGKLYIEPVGDGDYLYCSPGMRGMAHAGYDNGTKTFFLNIGNGASYPFDGKPLKKCLFRVPSQESIEAWLTGGRETNDIHTIYKALVSYFQTCFDFIGPHDAAIHALRVLLSWMRDVLHAFFFIGIDATKGAGKSSLLYAGALVSKHGAMAGDLTQAYIGRIVDGQKLCLFVDEIDQLPAERKGEIESVLRKAQKRGTPYCRVNPNTMEPEQFDVYGPHEYSYRGGVEDALSHRSMKTRLRVSGDESLPVINYHVEQVSRQLFEDLFFYFMENLPSYAGGQVTQVTASPGAPIATVRKELFDQFTSRLSHEEKELLGELAGRNVELAFVCFEASSLLGLDLLETIREGMKGKQNEEEVPDALYFDKLKEQLVNLYNTFPELKLQKGEFEGCFCYSKNGVFAVFHKALKSSDMPAIGSSRFNGLLKDIGFIEGVNWRNQKDENGKSVKSLIYTPEILKALDLKEPVV